jgi:hypothetical protein
MPVFDFFFSQRCLTTHAVGGPDAVELADTHRKTELFSDEMLEFRTGNRYMALAILQDPGEYLSTQFYRVAVPPLI